MNIWTSIHRGFVFTVFYESQKLSTQILHRILREGQCLICGLPGPQPSATVAPICTLFHGLSSPEFEIEVSLDFKVFTGDQHL